MISRAVVAILGGLLLLGSGRGGGEEAEPGSYAELLRFVPEGAEYRRHVVIVDYAALRALPLPEDAPADLTAVERLTLVSRHYTGVGLIAPLGSQAAAHWPEIRENWELGFGFTLDDIERELHFTNLRLLPDQGIGSFGLAVGRFNGDAVLGRLASCGECEPHEASEYAGWTILSWPDGISLEPEDRLAPPMRDNLGRGGQIAITDERIVRADRLVMLTAALDAQARDGAELREDPFVLLAEVLEPLSPLTVILSGDHQGPEWSAEMAAPDSHLSPGQNEERKARYDPPASEVRLRPYVAYAMGAGLDGDEHVVTMILLHESEADAEANIERLSERLTVTTMWGGRAWTEVYPSWSITSKGQFLIATFPEATWMWAAPLVGEPLLLHE